MFLIKYLFWFVVEFKVEFGFVDAPCVVQLIEFDVYEAVYGFLELLFYIQVFFGVT